MKYSLPHSYIDQLLSDNWVRYSETALSRQHNVTHSVTTGFQDVILSTGSNDRTRAQELFTIGLLRGPLIKPQESPVSIPLGWQFIQSNEHVHTNLGYVSYVVGKGLQEHLLTGLPPAINNALSILCSVFMLQLGMQHRGKHILLPSLFEYILSEFQKPNDIAEFLWWRYVSAAMFCTLHNDQFGVELVDAYIQGQRINNLKLIVERAKIEFPNIDVRSYSPPYNSEFSSQENTEIITKINSFIINFSVSQL